eukprot:10411_1
MQQQYPSKLKLDSQSFSCSAISFGEERKRDGHHYRGITSTTSSFTLNHNMDDNMMDIAFVPSHVQHKNTYYPQKQQQSQSQSTNKSMQIIDFEIDDYSKLKMEPLNITITNMDIIENEENDEIYSPSSRSVSACTPPPALQTSSMISAPFKYCNELNSYLVDNSDCIQVLNKLNNILVHYNDDIDFKIDDKNNRIDGVVFMSNYHTVFFTFYIWSQDDQIRFEFRRQSGDALAAAKFWSDIQNLYKNKN